MHEERRGSWFQPYHHEVHKDKWKEYEYALLKPYGRNNGDRNMKDSPTDQTPTYPLTFSDSEEESVKTFQECKEKNLFEHFDKGKYIMYEQEVKDYYDGGVHQFLTDMEERYKIHKCAGICKKNLFYITQDISEGIPEIECVEAAVLDADE